MTTLDIEKPVKTSAQQMHDSPEGPRTNPEIASLATFSSYSGPIPLPSHLAQYEKMVPGIAKKFLEEPHLEAEHRRALENKMVDAQIKLGKRGQFMAFSLALICIICSFMAIFLNHSLLGLGTLFLSIAAFVGVFIYGKNQKSTQS